MKPLLITTPTYEYMRSELVATDKFEPAELEVDFFPDGERYMRIGSKVENRDVFLVGGTVSDTATMELYDLACAAAKFGARFLIIVIPYFGYATMERATKFGEVVTAKTRARLLSVAIPSAMNGNRFVLLDVHSEGVPYYFEKSVFAKHLYAKSALFAAFKKYMPEHFVLASTDAGRAKWVQSLADEYGVEVGLVLKRRLSATKTELAAVSANVDNKDVAIYDDMIRTGGSLISAARAYKEAGAKSITAFATHGVLPDGALEKLQDSGLFTKVICTNSHPRAVQQANEFLHVVSITDILLSGLTAEF